MRWLDAALAQANTEKRPQAVAPIIPIQLAGSDRTKEPENLEATVLGSHVTAPARGLRSTPLKRPFL